MENKKQNSSNAKNDKRKLNSSHSPQNSQKPKKRNTSASNNSQNQDKNNNHQNNRRTKPTPNSSINKNARKTVTENNSVKKQHNANISEPVPKKPDPSTVNNSSLHMGYKKETDEEIRSKPPTGTPEYPYYKDGFAGAKGKRFSGLRNAFSIFITTIISMFLICVITGTIVVTALTIQGRGFFCNDRGFGTPV